MIEKLEINHLRTLDALYKFENLSAAAEYLNVSQQAVSLQLKKLRDILSDQLFVRTGHGVVATPYAKLIQPHVRQVLMHLNEIPLPGSVTPANTARTLVISATDYTQKIIVGELINELRISAPGVKIIVINIESANLIQKMHQGEIDLTLTSNGYVPAGLVSDAIFTERYVCVSANKDIVFDDYLPLERLVDYDFVVTSPGIASFKGSADSWFEQQKLRRKVQVSVPSFFMAQEYLKQSGMVGFLPSRLMPCAGLFEIPLKKYPPGYEVVAAYHPSARNDAFMVWLLDKIKKKFSPAT
ncbi:LysR family transcriptional regulator [Undibacterium sp. YM2]|uniref:LysR family transcriptional regulator n=1 Tax=Undibacterium sp. YM2 TaxID=2058625 RepID=UPI001331F1B2|nr:LysR family transcriptional regulator [Undibacterium sp. YM2]BBB68688.1 LysR family transcriptional regulator [Undibacterium sp. YM2]